MYTRSARVWEYRTMATVDTAEELGSRIREARAGRGMSQSDLARHMRLDRTAITRLEQGERQVTTLELLGLSRALDLPVSYFVERPSPDVMSMREPMGEEPTRGERVRFVADTLLDAWLRAAEMLRSEGLLDRVADLPQLDKIESAHEAQTVAQRAREFAGISGPIGALQEACERFGLYVFVADIDMDGASRSPDPGYGVALVGQSVPPGRRRMTAAHELGHHLLGDAYSADIGGAHDDRERWIDAFAAEFLLPEAALRDGWSGWLAAGEEGTWTALLRVAAEHRVSWSLVVTKAADAGLVTQSEKGRLLGRAPTREDFLTVTGRDVAEDLTAASYGPTWTKAVMRAAATSIITRARASELLKGSDPFEDRPDADEPEL